MDLKTDELMQQIIREEFKAQTIIAVAHRLDTILDFDRIAVLHQGKLVECGKPSDLLRQDSMFRRLYESIGHATSEAGNT